MVALSVSISAKISPSFTGSPTFFNQVATVPSSIVSLKRGIFITSAIAIIYRIKKDNLLVHTHCQTLHCVPDRVIHLHISHILPPILLPVCQFFLFRLQWPIYFHKSYEARM